LGGHEIHWRHKPHSGKFRGYGAHKMVAPLSGLIELPFSIGIAKFLIAEHNENSDFGWCPG